MTSIITRSSVVSLKKETTEGTLVFPSAATSYIPVEEDFKIVADFDSLANAEIKNSLAPSKPIQGLENPTSSFSLYLKHSGVSGTAPVFGPLLEAAFGEVDDAGIEHDTVSSSSVSVVKVDTGEGATYQKGQLLLVQDGVNGYSIRPVASISSDNLTLGFNLTNAPGTGILLGEAIMYRPANSGHPSISLVQYLGNGGAIEALSGGRVTDVSVKFQAGDLINASYSVAGTKFYMNPIDITASNKYMDFTDDSGTVAASIPVKTYRDPHEVAQALADAMNAVSSNTITVTYSNTTGHYTIASDGSTLSLLVMNGTNHTNGIAATLGFAIGSNLTGALTYTGASALSFVSPYTPTFDSSDPLAAKNNLVLLGDATDNVCFQASAVDFTLSNGKTDIKSICSESGKSGSVISSRTAKISLVALLDKYDVDKFKRFRENANTQFLYAFGEKSGGNWVKGKSGGIWSPTMTITKWDVAPADNLATLTLELTAYADNTGALEIFLGFV